MIQRALEKRPEDRYQSAMDLRRDLEDLKRDVDTGELRVADLDPSRARPVLGPTPEAAGLRHSCRPDSLVGLGRPSGATVVAFVTDGRALRDVLDHLGFLRSGDELTSPPPARIGPWMRWGES
jgi:hypothetical protein